MQRILMLRSLVLTPEQDIHSWLKFATLCRIKRNFRMFKEVRRGGGERGTGGEHEVAHLCIPNNCLGLVTEL